MANIAPSADEMKRLADLPGAGNAAEEIRDRYDPDFGIDPALPPAETDDDEPPLLRHIKRNSE